MPRQTKELAAKNTLSLATSPALGLLRTALGSVFWSLNFSNSKENLSHHLNNVKVHLIEFIDGYFENLAQIMVQMEVDFVRPHIAYRFFPLIEMRLYARYPIKSTFRTELL